MLHAHPFLVRETFQQTDAVVQMGKKCNNTRNNQQLPVSQSHAVALASGNFLCRSCTVGVCRAFNFKCVVVLILSLAAFLSAVFSLLPVRNSQTGFDAGESVKHSASVQAHFKLQKPVSDLIPYIARIEYDVNGEIGIPFSKVAVLSMHPAKLSDWTDVVVGFLPDPINSTIDAAYLSVLKSSLVEVFLQDYNLTLTSSLFGEPSSFEILKFPGGITIFPERNVAVQIPEVLFNFTLNSTINDIKDNVQQLKEELKFGLHLLPNEVLYIQVKNKNGSTKDPPVTVEASVSFGLQTLLPDRLRELAQTITRSQPTENLGLDHTVFGKVKEISLSSFLNLSLVVPPPTSSPCPAPSPDYGPSMAPSYSPAISPSPDEKSCLSPASHPPSPSVTQGTVNCDGTEPPSPSPTPVPSQALRAPIGSPLVAPSPQISPRVSDEKDGNGLVSLHLLSGASPCSSCPWRIPWFQLFGLLSLHFIWILNFKLI